MNELAGVLALIGAVLILFAGAGVLRLPDLYTRMHAVTKVPTLGFGFVALAGAIAIDGAWPKVVLAAVFILITAPAAAQFVGRMSYDAEGVDVELACDALADERPDPAA